MRGNGIVWRALVAARRRNLAAAGEPMPVHGESGASRRAGESIGSRRERSAVGIRSAPEVAGAGRYQPLRLPARAVVRLGRRPKWGKMAACTPPAGP